MNNRLISENKDRRRNKSMDNGASSYRRFLDGDDNGFVEIVRDYKDGLILFLDSFVRNLTVAEDLAEDTFVKLGIKKPHFSGKSSFKTWLYAIGRNVAVDYIRKESKCSSISIYELPIDECIDLADRQTLEDAYLKEERKIVIHQALGELKPEYRQVLWLTYFEELSNKETAMIMRKSVHNIETLIYRAKQSLKSELVREGFTYEDI